MITETFFQLHYHLTDTERLFDLAQGIAVQRRRLKKHDARCRSFRWFSRRLLWQGAVLLALGPLAGCSSTYQGPLVASADGTDEATIRAMCEKLLANTVIENFTIEQAE